MRGLLLRVSQLDDDAANALRIIGFFDTLMSGPANLDMVLRQAAALAECAVGISSPDRAISLQAAPGSVRHLGLNPNADLRVLAANYDIGGHAARLGSVWALLCPGPTPEAAASGGRLGIGPKVPANEAARSWHAARNALRFASEVEPVIHWDELGCLGLLAAQFGCGDLDHADLTALDRLAAERRGASILAVLDTFCATGSARKTAALLYHHHSTIADHLARAQTALRFPLDTPTGRFRLHLALTLRKLRDNPDDR